MGKAMIIGCGGVASVAIHKCCQNSEVFTELCLASRTKAKCDALRDKLAPTTATKISTAQVDANNVAELTRLLEQERPEIVMVHRRADKGLLFVLNKTEQVLREMYAIEELGLDTGWNLFDLADGKKESLWEERLVVELQPLGCRLFLLDKENEVTIDRERLWNNLR